MEPQRVAISREPDYGAVDAHPRLVIWLFICTVVACLLFIPLVLYFDVTGHGRLTIGVTVLVAGAGGGFVSSLRRLHCFEDIFPRREYVHLFRKFNFYVIAYSLIPPIVGAVGAIIIYLLFAGGVLTGDLFPKFVCTEGHTCTDFHGFVASWAPADAQANAKAIIWAFIAGFSERLVPDILNRLGSENARRTAPCTQQR
jgi:hypothetical protein